MTTDPAPGTLDDLSDEQFVALQAELTARDIERLTERLAELEAERAGIDREIAWRSARLAVLSGAPAPSADDARVEAIRAEVARHNEYGDWASQLHGGWGSAEHVSVLIRNILRLAEAGGVWEYRVICPAGHRTLPVVGEGHARTIQQLRDERCSAAGPCGGPHSIERHLVGPWEPVSDE